MKTKKLIFSLFLTSLLRVSSLSLAQPAQLSYYDLLVYVLGGITRDLPVPEEQALDYTNLSSTDPLFPILQKAVYYGYFPNYSAALPLQQPASQQDFSILIKATIGQEVLANPQQTLTFDWLRTQLSPLLTQHQQRQFTQHIQHWLQENYLYPERLPQHKILSIAEIKPYLDMLDDPYTQYYSPEQAKQLLSLLQNQISGIGVVLSAVPEQAPQIVQIIEQGPAEQGGLQIGDQIVQIDEHHWEQIQDFHLFTSYLRGEEGTLVQLIVQRGDKKLTFSLKRAKIQIPILHSDPQHCYLQLFNFDEGSAKAFSQTLQSWTACPRYVIDLRSNLGGIIDEALEMLSLFLPEKTPLVTLHSASGIQTRYASAHSSDISPLPLIILIDRNTASAAEIFAGVLKYYFPERVQLIGEASFGKGTVQEIISLPNDALLKYTIALRHIAQQPDSLDHKGLMPDRVAYDDPQTPEDEVLLSIGLTD